MTPWLKGSPCVYVVTDRRQLAPEARTTRDELVALEGWLDEALAAEVDVIQIRERDLDAAALCSCAARVVARARGRRTAVFVNDRVDVALAAEAAGVHLRAAGLPESRVRLLGPAGWVIGRSVHVVDEVRAHPAADYVLFGTIFAGGSKPAGSPVQGLKALARAVAVSRAPVIAIGGINPERARQCAAAGAAGVAGIGVFLPPGRAPGALGPARATVALRAALGDGAGGDAAALCLPDSALLE